MTDDRDAGVDLSFVATRVDVALAVVMVVGGAALAYWGTDNMQMLGGGSVLVGTMLLAATLPARQASRIAAFIDRRAVVLYLIAMVALAVAVSFGLYLAFTGEGTP